MPATGLHITKDTIGLEEQLKKNIKYGCRQFQLPVSGKLSEFCTYQMKALQKTLSEGEDLFIATSVTVTEDLHGMVDQL